MWRQRMDCSPSSSAGNKSEPQFVVEIFCDDLGIVAGLKNHLRPSLMTGTP